MAVEDEIDGIVVSNHGGRQVDGAIASLDALRPIVRRGREARWRCCSIPGSARAGTPSRRSALGADAVLIGRPYLYGLALGGQEGTRAVVRRLVAELAREVRKAGHRRHRCLSRSSLIRGGGLRERHVRDHPSPSSSRPPPPPPPLAIIAPNALAAPRRPPSAGSHAPLPALPVGPSAAYSAYQSEIYIAGMGAGHQAALHHEPHAARGRRGRGCSGRRAAPPARGRRRRRRGERERAGRSTAWRIVPRMFIDREKRDLLTTVLGARNARPDRPGTRRGQAARASLRRGGKRPGGRRPQAHLRARGGRQHVVRGSCGAARPTARAGSGWTGRRALRTARCSGARARLAAPTWCSRRRSPTRTGARWRRSARRGAGRSSSAASRRSRTHGRRSGRGVDGIIVSNERGRRGTDPVGTIDALANESCKRSGTRSPSSSAQVCGRESTSTALLPSEPMPSSSARPYVHGLAPRSGEAGVRHMLRTLLAELDIALAIAGVENYRALRPDSLVTAERAGRGPARKRRPKRRPRRR